MALSLDPVYFNRSAGAGKDKVGACIIELKNALHANWLASGSQNGWRRTAQGDGVGAFSAVIDADIFTGNGGLGYEATNATWASVKPGSISNPRAWIQWTLYLNGVSTGRMIQCQRTVLTAIGDEAKVTFGTSTVPFTGTANFNTAPATTSAIATTWGGTNAPPVYNGNGDWSWSSGMANPPTISGGTIFAWHIWTDDGTGEGGYQGAFMFALYDVTHGDYGPGGGYLLLRDTAAADVTPYITGGSSWQAAFGSRATYTDGGNFTSNATTAWKCFQGGLAKQAGIGKYADIDVQFPPGNSAQPGVDLDGNHDLLPWVSYIDNLTGVQSVRKGIVIGARLARAGATEHVYPHVATATDGSVWVLLGCMAAPWRTGVVPLWTWTSPSSASTWVVRFPEAAEVVVDVTPPTVDLVSPPEDGEDVLLTSEQTVTVDIGDETAIGYYAVYAIYESIGVRELVLESEDLDLETSYTIIPSTVGGKLRYEIVRTGGWPAPVRIRTRVIDTSGNVV